MDPVVDSGLATGSGTAGRLIVRIAQLFVLKPVPTDEHVREFRDSLKTIWLDVSSDLCRELAHSFDSDVATVGPVETEDVRLRRDGKTPMVDFPRIRGPLPDGGTFDVRVCMAICTERRFSSKLWVRIGLPHASGFADADLNEARAALFRAAAVHCLRWVWPKLKAGIPSALKAKAGGQLEVSAIGWRDEALRVALERLESGDVTAAELLSVPEDRKVVERAFRPLLGDDARQILRQPKSVWFSSPTSIATEGGWIRTRDSLYLLHQQHDRVQALGVGYDDSVDGDLAWRSALTVSRWIATRV